MQPHLRNHAPVPLLEPLNGEEEGAVKGWSPEEGRLLSRLEGLRLAHRVAKVAVLDAAGIRLAAVKLQAGNWETGEFSLRELNRDAVHVLETCFSPPTSCDHVDLWAAVPYNGPDGRYWHWPVFSVSCWRGNFARVVGNGLTPAELLASVSMVRYDPLFLQHAVDGPLAQSRNFFAEPVPKLRPTVLTTSKSVEARAIVRGSPQDRTVAITIDDGPNPIVTPLILHILHQAGVRATFFVVGEKIIQYPQLFLDIVSAGHEVGNHAFTDRRLVDLSLQEAASELVATSRLIEQMARIPCHLMRPPGGEIDAEKLALCARLGLTAVFWSKNTGDWQPKPASAIVSAALNNVRGGDIVLLHNGRPESALALREIVAALKQMGLQPGRVSDLSPGAVIHSGSPDQVVARLRAA
ncbi:MAG: polysaccharide deacetylase family protein, partial [Armatimonadetes bacterium]|nr:polysaccharide deacetylase family protein [Armatimonadota bacterium]